MGLLPQVPEVLSDFRTRNPQNSEPAKPDGPEREFLFIAGLAVSMKKMLVLLVLALAANAAIDQSYVQTLSGDGSSTIQKTMDLSLFANQLPASALSAMAAFCSNTTRIICSVDVDAKKISISESFQPGGYYTVTTEYDLFMVTHRIVVDRIPTDRFAADLDDVLLLSNVTSGTRQSNVAVLDLNDRQANAGIAATLRMFKANMTYAITMPGDIAAASAGNTGASVTGKTANFDLVAVMAQSAPLVVASRELNAVSIVALLAIVVLGALALSFFKSAPKSGAKKKKAK